MSHGIVGHAIVPSRRAAQGCHAPIGSSSRWRSGTASRKSNASPNRRSATNSAPTSTVVGPNTSRVRSSLGRRAREATGADGGQAGCLSASGRRRREQRAGVIRIASGRTRARFALAVEELIDRQAPNPRMFHRVHGEIRRGVYAVDVRPSGEQFEVVAMPAFPCASLPVQSPSVTVDLRPPGCAE